MKRRITKKQCKKVLGHLNVDKNTTIVNVVSNPEYLGGTCVERDEDCYRCEVKYTRKRYGAPLHVKAKHEDVFLDIYDKLYGHLFE